MKQEKDKITKAGSLGTSSRVPTTSGVLDVGKVSCTWSVSSLAAVSEGKLLQMQLVASAPGRPTAARNI
jgi:hypothetical protein